MVEAEVAVRRREAGVEGRLRLPRTREPGAQRTRLELQDEERGGGREQQRREPVRRNGRRDREELVLVPKRLELGGRQSPRPGSAGRRPRGGDQIGLPGNDLGVARQLQSRSNVSSGVTASSPPEARSPAP
jgi:hypothetical protein